MTLVDRRYGVSGGLAAKAPCRAATTANITLSGEQTVDGVVLAAGDRVLVKNQSAANQNGVYVVSTGNWTRALDFDGARDIVKGTVVRVTDGASNIGFWEVTASNPIVVGTSNISFAHATSALAGVSSFAQTLLDDPSANAFLTTLGIAFVTGLTGLVAPFAGTSAPGGWLFCHGQAVSRTTNAALFAVIGTTYGAGDGSTTFNLPDLRGRVVAGKDDMGGASANRLTNQSGGLNGDALGASGGAETHILVTAQLPAHAHTGPSHTHNVGYANVSYTAGATPRNVLMKVGEAAGVGGSDISDGMSASGTGATSSVGSHGAHNNVQPTFILNYIIKT